MGVQSCVRPDVRLPGRQLCRGPGAGCAQMCVWAPRCECGHPDLRVGTQICVWAPRCVCGHPDVNAHPDVHGHPDVCVGTQMCA